MAMLNNQRVYIVDFWVYRRINNSQDIPDVDLPKWSFSGHKFCINKCMKILETKIWNKLSLTKVFKILEGCTVGVVLRCEKWCWQNIGPTWPKRKWCVLATNLTHAPDCNILPGYLNASSFLSFLVSEYIRIYIRYSTMMSLWWSGILYYGFCTLVIGYKLFDWLGKNLGFWFGSWFFHVCNWYLFRCF
jgi:hypothetical protein